MDFGSGQSPASTTGPARQVWQEDKIAGF